MQTECDFLDVNEAATYLKMSVAWIRAQVLNKQIPFYKIGRCVRFSKEEMKEYLKKCRQEILN